MALIVLYCPRCSGPVLVSRDPDGTTCICGARFTYDGETNRVRVAAPVVEQVRTEEAS